MTAKRRRRAMLKALRRRRFVTERHGVFVMPSHTITYHEIPRAP